MSPRRLRELTPRERRRAIVAALVRGLVSCVAIFVFYFALPLEEQAIDVGAVFVLLFGATLFVLVMWWQFRRILRADLPQLQAFETVIVAVPLFIVVYAATYLLMSHLNHASFTQTLDHVGSLYFTIVTLGTVGYGDIAPKTDVARLVVSSQVLLDLALIAMLVRAVIEVTRHTLSRDTGEEDEPGPG